MDEKFNNPDFKSGYNEGYAKAVLDTLNQVEITIKRIRAEVELELYKKGVNNFDINNIKHQNWD